MPMVCHAYGVPREDSDIDLVVICDDSQTYDISRVAGFRNSGSDFYPQLRFGKLNFITVKDQKTYDQWLSGTNALIALRDAGLVVTRDTAIAVLDIHLGRIK